MVWIMEGRRGRMKGGEMRDKEEKEDTGNTGGEMWWLGSEGNGEGILVYTVRGQDYYISFIWRGWMMQGC